MSESRWSQQRNIPSGCAYDERWCQLADSGQNIHGEADFISELKPASVLDAGCGTGRVAIELAQRGIDCVGVDLDPEMLAAASQKAPTMDWVEGDLKDFSLGRTFNVAVLAGNVMIFVLPGSEGLVLDRVVHHLDAGGLLVAGFSLDSGGIALGEYDSLMNQRGLSPAGRWSTWQRDPFTGGPYAVSAHRKT